MILFLLSWHLCLTVFIATLSVSEEADLLPLHSDKSGWITHAWPIGLNDRFKNLWDQTWPTKNQVWIILWKYQARGTFYRLLLLTWWNTDWSWGRISLTMKSTQREAERRTQSPLISFAFKSSHVYYKIIYLWSFQSSQLFCSLSLISLFGLNFLPLWESRLR